MWQYVLVSCCCLLLATSDTSQNEILRLRVQNHFKWPKLNEDRNGTTTRKQVPKMSSILFSQDDGEARRDDPRSISSPNVFFTQSQIKDHVAIHYPEAAAFVPNNSISNGDTTSTSLNEVSNPVDFFHEISKFEGKPDNEKSIKSMTITLSIVSSSFWEDQNIIFSPLSLTNILAVLFLGADGTTFAELAEGLHLKSYLESERRGVGDFHESFRKLRQMLTKPEGKNVSIELVNQMFFDRHFKIADSYINNVTFDYDCPVQQFDFHKEGKKFKDQINLWVREKTQNKITSILDSPPSPDTALVIANVIYFKGAWEVPFPEKITRRAPFYVQGNETMHVPMMTNVLKIPYFEGEDFQMIAVPYKGSEVAYFVILPKAPGIEGLKAIENRLAKLQPEDLLQRMKQMRLEKVAVKLPKMKFNTDGNMNEILEHMGMPSMFSSQRANFSKMSDTSGIFVSSILHRAMIEVNEKGTEAAAVTVATADRIIEEPPIPFVANKPFMFFVYHIPGQVVLFFGRVTRPQWRP